MSPNGNIGHEYSKFESPLISRINDNNVQGGSFFPI